MPDVRQKKPPSLILKRLLWHDGDLADAEYDAMKCADTRENRLLLEDDYLVADANRNNIPAALKLAESVAKAETERETNLNTRGAAVATVAGLIVPIATALASPVFTSPDKHWAGPTRTVAEYFFLIALVSVARAMVMAVVGVLRPGRGGQTKNAVSEALVNVWCLPGGDTRLAWATDRKIAVFQLDRLLRAIPTWHYRNRSKARWLRRAWIFVMIGIIFIASAGVIFITKLSVGVNWKATVSVIAGSLIAIWLLLWSDLIVAGRKQVKNEEDNQAKNEAKKILRLLGASPEMAGFPSASAECGPDADHQNLARSSLISRTRSWRWVYAGFARMRPADRGRTSAQQLAGGRAGVRRAALPGEFGARLGGAAAGGGVRGDDRAGAAGAG